MVIQWRFIMSCDSRLCKGIGEEISGEQRDEEMTYIYEAS
jgi:hypothetical protein